MKAEREKKKKKKSIDSEALAESAYPSLFQGVWNFVFLHLFVLSFCHVLSSHTAT